MSRLPPGDLAALDQAIASISERWNWLIDEYAKFTDTNEPEALAELVLFLLEDVSHEVCVELLAYVVHRFVRGGAL